MKKTYMIPTVKVTALTESEPLCSTSANFTSGGSGSASTCNSKGSYFDDEYEDEEDY